MTSEERKLIQEIASKPVGSLWGYWPFVLPVTVVVIGVAVQIALLSYFNARLGHIDILIRSGTKVELLWESQLVKEAVLTVSFSITGTFALLAFLAYRSHKQAILLKAAVRELGIEHDQGAAANGNPPVRPQADQAGRPFVEMDPKQLPKELESAVWPPGAGEQNSR